MKKFITPTYTFTPGISGVGTVNLSGITGFNVKNLVSIINQTKGVVIYATGSQSLRYTNVAGTTVTLFFDTSSMSASDTLQVIYEDNSAQPVEAILLDKNGNEVPAAATPKGALAVGNSLSKFRDAFVLGAPDLTVWDQSFVNQGTTFVTRGGEANGSSYLKISMCPFTAGSEYYLTSKELFKFPLNFGFGFSASSRPRQNNLLIGLAGVDSNSNVQYVTPKADVALPSTVTVASLIITINFATNHSFKGGDRVSLYGNGDNRLNIGPVTVSVITEKQITIPTTLGNATYTAGGFIRFDDPVADLYNGALVYTADQTLTTSYNTSARRNGASFRTSVIGGTSSQATTSGSSNFTESYTSSNMFEVIPTPDDTLFTLRAPDAVSSPGTPVRFSQGSPDDTINYKIFIAAKNNIRMPRPIARIVSAVKSGSNGVTYTTDVPHNLNLNSRITIYGVRDAANFPNLTSPVSPTTIINSTQFIVPVGTSATASSAGGRVDLCEGGDNVDSANFPSVQSISRTDNVMTITLVTTVSGLSQGETIHLYGCDATSMGLYDGAYLVRRFFGSTIMVDSVGANFSSINCGGAILRRLDYRIHFVRVNDYARTAVEITGNTSSDAQRSIPVVQTGTATVSVSGTPSVIISGQPTFNLNTPIQNLVHNGTVTSNSNSASSIPLGVSVSFQLNIGVVSGTNPTMDVTVQESFDAGITWLNIYAFPRVTSTNVVQSPTFPCNGNRYRVTFIVGGTTPSFSTGVNMMTAPTPSNNFMRNVYDRVIAVNTLSSTSQVISAYNATIAQLSINMGAITTTAPAIQLQASVDNSSTWFNIGTPLTAVANSTVNTVVSNLSVDAIRAIVTTAGSGATLNYIQLRTL